LQTFSREVIKLDGDRFYLSSSSVLTDRYVMLCQSEPLQGRQVGKY